MNLRISLLSLIGAAGIFMLLAMPADASDIRDIVFPVLGESSHYNDFGAPRSGGRTHQGNDIIGYKHQPLVAAIDGLVSFVAYPEPYYGFAVFIDGEDDPRSARQTERAIKSRGMLLGLYQGVPLPKRSAYYSGVCQIKLQFSNMLLSMQLDTMMNVLHK